MNPRPIEHAEVGGWRWGAFPPEWGNCPHADPEPRALWVRNRIIAGCLDAIEGRRPAWLSRRCDPRELVNTARRGGIDHIADPAELRRQRDRQRRMTAPQLALAARERGPL